MIIYDNIIIWLCTCKENEVIIIINVKLFDIRIMNNNIR
jgi:hypothetical protein